MKRIIPAYRSFPALLLCPCFLPSFPYLKSRKKGKDKGRAFGVGKQEKKSEAGRVSLSSDTEKGDNHPLPKTRMLLFGGVNL